MSKTQNKRIYAIGDIHGCLDQLVEVQARISNDLVTRPHADPVTIYVGDFMDRGPESKGVIDNLLTQKSNPFDTRFLLGNHDEMLLDFLTNPAKPATKMLHWLDPRLGGAETIRSYGLTLGTPHWLDPKGGGVEALRIEGLDPVTSAIHAEFQEALPPTHLEFLHSLDLYHQIGDYVFAHAGIRPGIPLSEQVKEDLYWIREPFLSSHEDHGFIVVHGHSPVRQVENHGNRIAIDTGAVFGRELSCLVLEGESQQLLSAEGLVDCRYQLDNNQM